MTPPHQLQTLVTRPRLSPALLVDELCVWWLLRCPPSSDLIICWVGTPGTQESTLSPAVTDLLGRRQRGSRQGEERPGAEVGAAVLAPARPPPRTWRRSPTQSFLSPSRGGCHGVRFPALDDVIGHWQWSVSRVCLFRDPGAQRYLTESSSPSSCLGLSATSSRPEALGGAPRLFQNRGH